MKKAQELVEYRKDHRPGVNAKMTNSTSYVIEEESDCPAISAHT
jgi:hypothetical protein